MSHYKIVEKKVSDKRTRIIEILREMFEVEFPKQYTSSLIDKLVEDQITRKEKVVNLYLKLSEFSDEYHLSEFQFNVKIREHCYKKIFGIVPIQNKFKDINIADLLDDIELFDRISDRENIVKEVIQNSSALKEFRKDLTDKGYVVSIHYHIPFPSSATIKIRWF